MTQDEIIEMARQAGGEFYVTSGNQTPTWYFPHSTIYDFADLVAQEVRDRIMFGSRDDWVLAEREACAKVCEDYMKETAIMEARGCLASVAYDIRARGEQA